MALVTNDFESGSNGATITIGDGFDVVNVGTGATTAFDNTHAANGALAYKMATTGTVAASDVEWSSTTLGAQTTIYGRFYIYKTANPAASVRIMTLATSGGAALIAGLYLMTNGTILGVNTSVGNAAVGTNVLPNNAWSRVEFRIVSHASAGVVEVKTFTTDPESTVPDQTITGTAQNTNGGAMAIYSVGMGFDTKVNVGPMWFDDIGFNSVGYMGPVGVPVQPVVVSRATGVNNTNGTSHALTLPGTYSAGDLLVCVMSIDGNPTATIGGSWTKLRQDSQSTNVTGAIFYKVATGSDAATVTTTASEMTSHVTLAVRYAGTPVTTTPATNSASTNSNPPSLSPAGGSGSYLWIATRSGDQAVVATVAPTTVTPSSLPFTNLQSQAGNSTSGASTNTAELIYTGPTVDPGTFTSATESWVSYTIAMPFVAPPAVAPSAGGVTGTGAANDATVTIVVAGTDAPADVATETGSANDATVDLDVNATGITASALGVDAVAGVTVNAGAASATGAANDATVTAVSNISALAGAATATGSANDATVALAVNDTGATLTGVANNATGQVAISAPASLATASGSANDSAVALAVNDTGATLSGAAVDTSSTVTVAPAEAAATGLANDATVSAASNVSAPAGTASASGSANDSAVALAVNDTGATLTGAAGDASSAVSITPADVSATGTANDATVSTGTNTNAPADVASATGSANDASVALTVNDTGATLSGAAGNASSAVMITPADVVISGAANGPVIGIGANDSGVTASTTTNDGSSAVTVTPADANGTGAANDPTITAAGSVNAPAGVASASPIVDNPTIALTTGAVGATSSATAADPTIGAAASSVGATASATGQDALAALAASATGALSAGGALDALILVGVLAPAGVAGGSVLSPDAVIAIGAMGDSADVSGLAIDAFATSGARRGEMNSTDRKVPVLLVGAGASPSAQASNDESAPTMQPGSRNAATMRDE
jgi:hypothetical protein